MTQRMSTEDKVLKLVVDLFCRRVVVALDLVADDVDFTFYLMLGLFAAEDDVTKQIDSPGKVFALYGRIEHGVLLVGKGVEIASDTLQVIEDLQGRTTTRSLERRMFAKMGQSLLARCLMTGTGIDAYAAVNHG